MQQGMPRFDGFTRDQLVQIDSYIRAAAREVRGTTQVDAR